MTGTKVYCASARDTLQSLIKQYTIIKSKKYAIEADETVPLKREIARLQVVASFLVRDYNIVRDLPHKISEAADEWKTIIDDAKNEAVHDEAQKQFDAFRDQHPWDTIRMEACDDLLLTLSNLACICEENTEKLSKKLAELDKKASGSTGSNDFGDSTGGKGGKPHNTGHSSRTQRPHNFYCNADSQEHSSDDNGRRNNTTEDEGEDVGSQFDPRRGNRFYRGVRIIDARPPAAGDKSASAPAPLQLQNLPCPKFDGKITEFHTFRDRFLKFVDDPARNMQEADKMHFLLSQLAGKPLERCSGFPISTRSYYQILDMLADEYDHPEEVMEVLLHRLRSLKQPKENRHELNEFHCEVSRIIRQLEEMDVETNTYEILRTIQSKLPRATLSELLQREHEYAPWNTSALLGCLYDKVQIERKLVRILNPDALDPDRQPSKSIRYAPDPEDEPFHHDKGTAAFMTRSSHPTHSVGELGPCAFCGNAKHTAAHCYNYSTREARLQRCLFEGLCGHCCSRQPRPHLSTACPNEDQGCFTCKKPGHHQALCRVWLKQFAGRLERLWPQNNYRKNPTRGHRSPPPRSYVAASGADPTGASDAESDCDNGYSNPPLTEQEEDALNAAITEELKATNDSSEARAGYSVLANQANGSTHTKLLECTKAEVFNLKNGLSEQVIVFFDSGSDTTYVERELADRLQLTIKAHDVLDVDTFASKGVKRKMPVTLRSLGIRLTNGKQVKLKVTAGTGLIGNIRSALIRDDDVPLLRQNKCAIIASTERPLVLIGRDQQHHFRKRDDEGVLPSGFCLVHTLLGPILAGKGHVKQVKWASEVATTYRVVVDEPTSDEVLARTDENYWKTENIGISLPESEPDDELVFRRHRERLTRDEDGRYVTPIPWRTEDGTPVTNEELKPNYGLALGRLNTVLHNQPKEVLKQIDDSFKAQELNQVIEKVDPRERNAYTKHYLASQVVVKESSNTTKLRIVYDASAGSGKHTKSLNDCTHRGPVLIPNMPGMLLRARLSAIVLTADLEKAYLQLALPPEDRDVCRFLWVKDFTNPLADENLIVYRFRRVTFGLKPAPFMLAGTLFHHLDTVGTELAAEIKQNCYVDNIVLAADTVDQALDKYRQTKAIFADAKMNAREFASNSTELIAQLPKEDVSDTTTLFHSLGIDWDFSDDSWVMRLNRCSARKPQSAAAKRALTEGTLTRRQMSSRLQAIFDPMGLISPALIAAKLAIQLTYLLQIKWDDPVPDDIRELWQAAIEGWDATTIRIPRRVAPFAVRNPEIHIFVDASKEAYGIATYLRSYDGPSSKYHTTLIFSRAKVKPASEREKLTIPDLELMAMALGARNAQYIVENLGMTHSVIFLWSDSTINLQRVVTPWKQKQLWVENRLAEIRRFQEALDIRLRHVRTDQNPADIVSRGIPANELQSNQLWWQGPAFLQRPNTEWPPQVDILPLDNSGHTALPIEENTPPATSSEATTLAASRTNLAKPLVDIERTNDYQKLLLPTSTESGDDTDYVHNGSVSTRDRVLATLQRSNDRLQRFWKIWRDDYLAGLRARGYAPKPKRNGSTTRHPQIGDIVLVFDDTSPRSCWKLATIIELVTANANQIPSARIRFANRYEARRAINHLYPLELADQEIDTRPAQHPTGAPSSRRFSPPGGFGPLTGLEEEAPEDLEPPATEEVVQQNTQALIATRTRRRVATTKTAHWPHVLFSPGLHTPQTSRADDSVESA